ncbi:MAG: SpaA isopeptide-forming pilin-related protein [Coriobacteriaceae bacterium]|nr:SpaA isopeptide-forming pilin-related protein [Coriobacteriaceae bacterium]
MRIRFTNKSPSLTHFKTLLTRALIVAVALVGLALPRTADALPQTITGKADIVITNKQEAYYEGAVAQCKATIHLPDGSTQIATGQCISGDHYAVPLDGTYTYKGTLQPDGTYDIVIDSSTSPGANEGEFFPGSLWGTQKMGGIRLRYEPQVTITFTKTSASGSITSSNKEYSLAGASYDVFRADTNKKVASFTTDSKGKATLKLDPNTKYYAVETKAPAGFKLNTDRIYFTTESKPSTVELSDEAGTFVLSIKKKDSATGGAAQPGASFKGAEYRVVSKSTAGWERTGATDASGRLVIGSVPLGTIVVTETKSPEGYLLDDTPHEFHVGAGELNNQGTFELEPKDDFAEHVIAFDIEITKFTDSNGGTSGIQKPAKGVVFEIISNTTDKVVGSIATDEHGRASTAGKWFGEGERNDHIKGALPYDKKGYTVREDPSTTPEGFIPCPDWSISADQLLNGATLHYVVENTSVSSHIQIVKTDANSGQTIPLAGFTFQLLDSNKKPITQEVWTPSHEQKSEFTTDASGTVTFPQALKPGTYFIREVKAVPPYVVAEKDIEVVIEATQDLSPVTVVQVADEQAMGSASIVKQCGLDKQGLAGAEFDVVATQDVVSPDGAVQATAGQIVDHVVTDKEGKAETKPLPLGNGSASYRLIETKAPNGHVLDSTPYPFTLSYENDHTELVHTQVDITDKPTHLNIDKTVLGSDTPLEGVEFSLWRKDEQISGASNSNGTIALRAESGHTVTAQPIAPYATVCSNAPKNVSITLSKKGSEPVAISEHPRKVEPGTYTLQAQREGKPLDIGNASIKVRADMAYSISIRKGLFEFNAHANESEHPTEKIELPWSKEDGVYSAADVPSGSYRIAIDGKRVGTADLSQGSWFGTWSGEELERVPVLLKPGKNLTTSKTDNHGRIDFYHLKPGTYCLRESSAPQGIVLDPKIYSFTVSADGTIDGSPSKNLAITNDYTKIDISKRDITTEEEVPGAKLTVTDSKGKEIDSWISTNKPHRINALDPGSYILTEEMTPHTYDKAQSISFEVLPTGKVQTVVMHDKPLKIHGQIDKRQQIAYPTAKDTEPNGDGLNRVDAASQDGSFSYTLDFRNTSSSWVDEFTVEDQLESAKVGVACLESIVTPQAFDDFDGKLNVWYKTNLESESEGMQDQANATLDDEHDNPWLSDASNAETLGDDGRKLDYTGWRLWAQDISTTEATTLHVSDLDLKDSEYVTAIRLEYGRVEKGFTTRKDAWDRELLKDPHDDLQDTASDHKEDYAPAIVNMSVTNSYTEGTTLGNNARVDLFRNGGGPDLEDHDQDYVVQTPKKITRTTLAQTSDPSRLLALTVMGLSLICYGLSCRRSSRR